MSTSATIGQLLYSPKSEDITIPITIASDASGGALAAADILRSEAMFMKLDEVEIKKGTSTDKLTINNERGTKIFEIAALDATANKIYGGNLIQDIFPKYDCKWTIETDGFDADDEVIVYLKFTRYNG